MFTKIVLALTIALGGSVATSTVADSNLIQNYNDEYITEQFVIYEVVEDEVRGEILDNTLTGEGIYLLQSELSSIEGAPEKLEVGDKIAVTYNAEDYEDSVWDNIVKLEKIN